MKQFLHKHNVKDCCFSNNERYLGAIDTEGTLYVWDILVFASTVEISSPILSHKLKVCGSSLREIISKLYVFAFKI